MKYFWIILIIVGIIAILYFAYKYAFVKKQTVISTKKATMPSGIALEQIQTYSAS